MIELFFTESIENKIIEINVLLAAGLFEELRIAGFIGECEPSYLRQAFFDYFDNGGDPSDFARITVPEQAYIKSDAAVFYINPRQPSPAEWRVELNLLIDSQESDLTAIYYIDSTILPESVKLYAILTQ